jgi:RNA polymerase sigma-70 factor (ECF subfamily)
MFRVRAIEREVGARELTRWAAQGQRAAQRDLFRRLSTPVHETLYHILGSNEHMEGILEDAFVEIFRSLPTYDGKIELDIWASAIAVRVVCLHLRGTRRDSRPMDDRTSRVERVGSSGVETPRSAGLRQVYGLLHGLEPEQHVTLALFMMGHRSVTEIAALTRVNVAVVRERIRLAQHLLHAAAHGDSGLMASLAGHALPD